MDCDDVEPELGEDEDSDEVQLLGTLLDLEAERGCATT